MISVLHQSRQRVEQRRVWPALWPSEICSVASTPSGFAEGFDQLHEVDRGATSAALSALIGLVQAGDDLAASLLLCVFAPAIRKAARRFDVGVGEAAGELAASVSGYRLASNAAPTVGAVVKDMCKRLSRVQARDRRRRELVKSTHPRAVFEDMAVVETRVDFEALVERLELTDVDVALLASGLDGPSVTQCATVLGLAPTTLFERRALLRRRVRAGLSVAA